MLLKLSAIISNQKNRAINDRFPEGDVIFYIVNDCAGK